MLKIKLGKKNTVLKILQSKKNIKRMTMKSIMKNIYRGWNKKIQL